MPSHSYAIVIFATQTSPSKERLDEYKTRIGYVLRDLDVPVRIFTSTSYDPYRKPAPAAWTVFERDWNGDKEIGASLTAVFANRPRLTSTAPL